jgi:hypothetical protein
VPEKMEEHYKADSAVGRHARHCYLHERSKDSKSELIEQ